MTKGIHTIFLLLLLSILPIASCQVDQPVLDICAEQENSVSAVKILAIGDSRVEGRTPHSESYRYHLWRNFKLNSWDVNFLGSRLDNGEYAPVDGLCFDNEHEGISGATSSLILSRVRAFDADNVADVILLGIGGNDISNGNVRIQQIINNIRLIILQLKELYPESMIIVEQIAPGKSQFMTERLSNDLANFNKRLGILIHALSRFNRQLFTVDMSRDWSDTYLADDIHYNDTGAQVVADRYFTIISENYSE